MKKIKCSASLTFDLFSPTLLINSIKNEHSCKVLYLINRVDIETASHQPYIVQYFFLKNLWYLNILKDSYNAEF